jgi:hypothetical protein
MPFVLGRHRRHNTHNASFAPLSDAPVS